jgi:CRP-like cAMP-binding protein
VQLLDPEQEMQPFANLKPGDFFSRMAFFTGSPHRTSAIAKTDCEIATLPREAFEDLLETSPELNVATQRLVQGEEIAHYLQQRHYLTLDEVKNWVDQAIFDIQTKARIPDAISVENKADEFVKIARQVKRLPIFQYLPSEDIEAVANRLRYRRYKDGETLFYQNESSNELYIIHCGQIALSNPQNPSRKLKKLHPKDVVGEFSFLAGALHTVTAVADGDVGVWELSRIDFGELLKQSPELNQAVEKFLQQETVTGYLQRRQGFSPEQSAQWLEKAFDYLHGGKKPPSAQEMVQVLTEHKNAPLAIWAGLLIDGIPESLTIGANELAGAGVSATFVTGLFISNYPEALSSSDGMRQQGFSFARIFSMWTSVMLIQGILAGVGSLILSGAPESLVALIESIGAGAILTVMAETMLPEAYMRKGYWLGLSLLLGFLVIVLIKTLG